MQILTSVTDINLDVSLPKKTIKNYHFSRSHYLFRNLELSSVEMKTQYHFSSVPIIASPIFTKPALAFDSRQS